MDPNSQFNGFSPEKNSVFTRLYSLSLAKKFPVMPNSSAKPKRKGPRKEIEKDLISRHEKTKAKIHEKRLEQAAKELNKQVGIPKINKLSRSLLKKSQEEESKKDSGFSASKNSKRRVNSVIINDNMSSNDIKINLSSLIRCKDSEFSQSKYEEPQKFTPNGLSYSSIRHPQVNSNVDKEEEPQFRYEGDIPTRTQKWNLHKEKKIARKRHDLYQKETDGCSFRPDLTATMNRSSSLQPSYSFSQISSSKPDQQYFKIAPSDSKVTFSVGFDVNAFMAKAKPMVEYKAQKK